MRTVRIRSTGKTLYVVGDAPAKKGDRFEATDVLEADSPPGCQVGSLPGGGAYFSCLRRGHASAPIKVYVFDPAKHEVTE